MDYKTMTRIHLENVCDIIEDTDMEYHACMDIGHPRSDIVVVNEGYWTREGNAEYRTWFAEYFGSYFMIMERRTPKRHTLTRTIAHVERSACVRVTYKPTGLTMPSNLCNVESVVLTEHTDLDL